MSAPGWGGRSEGGPPADDDLYDRGADPAVEVAPDGSGAYDDWTDDRGDDGGDDRAGAAGDRSRGPGGGFAGRDDDRDEEDGGNDEGDYDDGGYDQGDYDEGGYDEGGYDDDALEQAEAAVKADLDVAAVVAQRDDYLDALRRVQADFENFKKQTVRRNTDLVQRAAESLVEKLLPVLDACDGAMAHDESHVHVRPVYDALMDALEKEGLEVVFPDEEVFDPNVHEAVVHEGDHDGEPVVTGVLRTGYIWKGRVLRPAMVKVKG